MKKILFSLLALACVACSKTQKTDDVVIRIIDEDMFSQCFTDCDTDGDGIVTKAEAEDAKILVLDRGG